MDNRLIENLSGACHNYIAPFLWLHNEADKYIVQEIDRIYNCGIRSVCLESRTHEEFCREDWWSDVQLIFGECKKRRMNVWILDDKHFPSGYANGIFAEKRKDLQAFGITEHHIDVAGPIKDGSAMAEIHLTSDEDEFVAVVAMKHIPGSERYSEVIDITDGLSDGMVYFDLPEGVWRIAFLIKTKSGKNEWSLDFCDMLSSEATDLFIEEVYEAHYKHFAEYFGNTFLGFFSDEPSFLNNTAASDGFQTNMGEMFSHYPWHDNLKNIFAQKPERLAGLWFDIDGVSEATRYEYMDTITKEYQKNFADKIGDWCRKHGIMYIGHVIEDNNTHMSTGNGAGHYFRALNGQDMSGVDVVLHQIVPGLTECASAGYVCYKHMNNKFFNYYLAKLGSSAAHIDPKKKGRAMCEIFGAYGWAEGTKMMKYLMDHMLVRGINYFVPHAFSPKPNDTDCPPNFYDTGRNPQYKFFGNNMNYLNNTAHMLSGGIHVPTCAILYDAENNWTGERIMPLEAVAKELYDGLYDYDIIPADYLDKIKDSTLNGEKYNVLFVPYSDTMPNGVKNALKNADVKVVAVSPDGDCEEFAGVRLDEICGYMAKNGFADVKSDYSGSSLRYYHYKRDNADIYMFVNEDIHNTIDTKLSISAFSGGEYVEYDSFENKAVVKSAEADNVRISLPPYHSLLLVFGDVNTDSIERYSESGYGALTEIKPEFKISLAERNAENFEEYRTTDKLFNVTGRGEKPHFSGHIKYEAEIELETEDIVLDLGYVGEVAELYVNGRKIGEKQIPPYRFDIPAEALCGKNELTVVVSNHNGYAVRDMFSQYLMFEPSGLLGPITLQKKENKQKR